MTVRQRFARSFANAPTLPLDCNSRYILFSDCHRGCGNSGDNFLKNQNLYFAALRHYYEQDFTYLELGDGDELWENRSFAQIKEIHSSTFWLLSRFYARGRLHMLYGNHDMVKRSRHFTTCNCHTYPCSNCQEEELFPGITFHAGIILKDSLGKKDLYLTHGHQADLINSLFWKFARFLVRYLWRPLENIGFLDPTSAAKNNTRKKKTERRLTDWARRKDCILITGHTHRPMTGSKDSPYFNTGSCVHPRCITGIEIVGRSLTLVKWTLATRADRSLYVAREELTSPICIEEML